MGFRVLFTSEALGDLERIVRFIARDNPSAAEKTGLALVGKAEALADMPEIGRKVPERKQGDWREIVSRPYRIVYRVRAERRMIEVLRFWHGARGVPVACEE